MSIADERNPVLYGDIDSGRVFVTFTEYTDEKIAHGLIFEALLYVLKKQGVVLKDGQPTTLVDLGCGEGHTAYEMVDAINRVNPQGRGVNYYGLDADVRFVRSTEHLLTEIKGLQRLRVINVRQANVLSGKPFPFASMDHVLATMGHVLYYAHSNKGKDQTRKNIAGVVDSIAGLLGQNGICLFAHSAQHCPLATIRASVADSVEAKPASIMAEIAKEKRLVVVSFIAPYKIHFPRLMPELWEESKEPSSFNSVRNRNDPRFVATLELLTFIAQRDLKGLAQEGKLGRFVDDVRAQVDADGIFESLSDYQLLLSRKHSPELRERVEAVVREVEHSLDRIAQEAKSVFNLRVQSEE
ncbi:MAG: class I SAM-dependent methyltransferase [bacterium]|nr:class I SAM-dependent methyltransferase [bacterium]